VLLRRRQERQALVRLSVFPALPVEAVYKTQKESEANKKNRNGNN
jgi:hypothetical protein